MDYQTKFPEDSPGLQSLIKSYLSSGTENHLLSEDGTNIYAQENLGSEQDAVEYHQYTDEQLQEYYQHLHDAKSTELDFTDLRESSEALFEPVEDKAAYHLPEIKKLKGNELDVKTEKNKKTFILSDLLKAYKVKEEDKLIFNLVAVDENGMQIDIQNKSSDDSSKSDISIFMSQDLEDVLVTQTYTKEFADSISSGDLEAFAGLLEYADSEKRFIKAANSTAIVDTETNELVQQSESDLVSEDHDYIYLAGNDDPLQEGRQHIQTLKDYVDGNETDHATYKLNYKQISDELELDSADEVTIGKTYYFKEDYIVLYLDFQAPIAGGAGATNVIIDLQNDKENPIIYLVDLGLH